MKYIIHIDSDVPEEFKELTLRRAAHALMDTEKNHDSCGYGWESLLESTDSVGVMIPGMSAFTRTNKESITCWIEIDSRR